MLEINKIYCCDCVNGMAQIENEMVDLTVTSPPYDNLREYYGFSFDIEKVVMQLFRITKKGGVVVWIVGDAVIDNSETGTSFKQALCFMQYGFLLHDTMIFEKNQCPFPEQNRYYQKFEYMFVFSKGKPKTTNLIKDRENKWNAEDYSEIRTRNKDGSINVRKEVKPSERFGVRFNIWKYNVGFNFSTSEQEAKQHPAIFPETLAKDHILSWSNEGDLVLDPFNGSGTTTKMAKYSGRNFIGFDISNRYCEIARNRIKQTRLRSFLQEKEK